MEESVSEGTGEGTQGAQENGATGDEQTKTFTQDEVNQLVGQARVDERRKVQSKFADYDELKTKAEGAKTLEERFAEIEQRAAKAEAAALRSNIAAKFSISPEDRDLFLTGADEETLTAQAQRLAQRDADRKKQGNVAPTEGGNQNPGDSKGDERAFARQLFGKTD
jgi:hypothetical protein